jgi:hypothetical protein
MQLLIILLKEVPLVATIRENVFNGLNQYLRLIYCLIFLRNQRVLLAKLTSSGTWLIDSFKALWVVLPKMTEIIMEKREWIWLVPY